MQTAAQSGQQAGHEVWFALTQKVAVSCRALTWSLYNFCKSANASSRSLITFCASTSARSSSAALSATPAPIKLQ